MPLNTAVITTEYGIIMAPRSWPLARCGIGVASHSPLATVRPLAPARLGRGDWAVGYQCHDGGGQCALGFPALLLRASARSMAEVVTDESAPQITIETTILNSCGDKKRRRRRVGDGRDVSGPIWDARQISD